MQFLIADTFTDSLTRLTAQEQKAAKTTAFDLQMDPTHPGLQYHKLDRAQDPNFASVKVNRDIRIIVHRTGASFMMCYVGHHDEAYNWAGRRKLETHPATGAAQIVEVRETVEEVIIPTYVVEAQTKPLLFEDYSNEKLLQYGVPAEWLADVKTADEDSLLNLADHLPREAAEALLELATGGQPIISPVIAPTEDPFTHPDAQRRFRVMENIEDLERALEYPWEKWSIFLHPTQKRFVEASYNGPARVSGSAGTGKTVVALHRAAYLARANANARVLLVTFSEPLANALREKLRRLIYNQPRLAECIEVYAINALGKRLYEKNIGHLHIVSQLDIVNQIEATAEKINGQHFSRHLLVSEWDQVIDAWQLRSWDAYRDVLRLGRKTRLPESSRKALWSIYEQVFVNLDASSKLTLAGMFDRLASHYRQADIMPFDYIIVDESQDINVAQLKFLTALGRNGSDSLFFTGDLGQRIFQQPFSWKSLGVDVRGRSFTLRVNYRTSHQIRSTADKLLGPEISDVDGIIEDRSKTVSVFNGPDPEIQIFNSKKAEAEGIKLWLIQRLTEGLQPEEIGMFVRSDNEIPRAVDTIAKSNLPYLILNEQSSTENGHISICTMHQAKGLEFRAVVVMGCDDEIIPSQERMELVTDESDLEEVYNTERYLLYVACTRARDHLLVTGVDPASEFIDDLTI